MANYVYFNFPIEMLKGITKDKFKVLDAIFDYVFYKTFCKYNDFNLPYNEQIEMAKKELRVRVGEPEKITSKGFELVKKYSGSKVMVGLSNSIFFDYYDNDKTDYQITCLLGFLAIKSVLGKKPFCKMNNALWLSRMNGEEKVMKGFTKLPAGIKKFNTRYQLDKIKTELQNNWGLKHYARYTRGFYVSFTLSLEELVFQAEKRRKSNKEKKRKKDIEEMRLKALKRLEQEKAP